MYYDGRPRWTFPIDTAVNGKPCMADNGDIYVGSEGGYVYAIRVQNRWSTDPSTPPKPEFKWPKPGFCRKPVCSV